MGTAYLEIELDSLTTIDIIQPSKIINTLLRLIIDECMCLIGM